MILRRATLDDLELLRHWDSQQHVIDADPNDDWGWEVELGRRFAWREQLIAEEQGRPIGFIQIIDPAREDSHYWGEIEDDLRAVDIWIGEESDLGRGFGTTMMELALSRCFAPPEVKAVLIDPLASNVRSHRFYERLGFRFVEKRSFGLDECHVYRLDRADYEALTFEPPRRIFPSALAAFAVGCLIPFVMENIIGLQNQGVSDLILIPIGVLGIQLPVAVAVYDFADERSLRYWREWRKSGSFFGWQRMPPPDEMLGLFVPAWGRIAIVFLGAVFSALAQKYFS